MTDQYKLCIRLPSCTCLFMHGLEEFSFSQYKKATAKKSPCILKYKDTFFSATFLLHVFEAAFFFPCYISINLLFHLQLSAAAFASVGSTYCYFHPLQLPPEQSNIRAKPNDVDFKSIKNRIVGCIWTPASLQEELLAEMFTVKPHSPLFQEQKFVNQERSFSGFARVCSHTLLARTTGWRNARCGGGWDDMLVCRERDDTDLEKEKSAVTMYSISCASPRHGVCAEWKSGCWSWFPAMKKSANCTLQPKAALRQTGIKNLLTEGLCQYSQITERCFGSFDMQSTVAQWWTGRVNGGSAQNTKRQSLCPPKELGSTAELVFFNGNAIQSPRL